MGIKDLHKFIAEKFPEVPEAVPVSSFRGYRIAVDVYGLGYILMATIRSRYIWSRDVIANPIEMSELELPWLKSYFDYILPWLKVGITPVFVFDGPNKGIKTKKMEKDRAEKETKKAELESIMQTAKTDAWKTDQGMLDRARKLLVSLNHIPAAQIETLKNIMQAMKFPVVQAPGDGETVCSALCKAGYVTGVFSADGDNLAHGCPLLIRDKADVLTRVVAGMVMEEDAFSIVRMSKLLDSMNLTQFQFTDFCIMCGCDYNERIPGIGPVKSLDRIREYGRIESIPLDTTVLNYQVCREEFTTVVDLKALEIDAPGALDVRGWDSMSSECMAAYNLETLIADYRTFIQRLPPPKNFHHIPSLTRVVVGDFDDLVGIVPLPKQEKKSKYAKKSRGEKSRGKKKENTASTDWRSLPVSNVFAFGSVPQVNAYGQISSGTISQSHIPQSHVSQSHVSQSHVPQSHVPQSQQIILVDDDEDDIIISDLDVPSQSTFNYCPQSIQYSQQAQAWNGGLSFSSSSTSYSNIPYGQVVPGTLPNTPYIPSNRMIPNTQNSTPYSQSQGYQWSQTSNTSNGMIPSTQNSTVPSTPYSHPQTCPGAQVQSHEIPLEFPSMSSQYSVQTPNVGLGVISTTRQLELEVPQFTAPVKLQKF